MDQTRGTQNHFKMRAPQSAHFGLQLEVRVPKECPYYEGNAIGKAWGNQEKRSPETDVHVQIDRLCSGRLGTSQFQCQGYLFVENSSVLSVGWQLSQFFTLFWLTLHSKCHFLVIIWLLWQVDLQAWHVLGTNFEYTLYD